MLNPPRVRLWHRSLVGCSQRDRKWQKARCCTIHDFSNYKSFYLWQHWCYFYLQPSNRGRVISKCCYFVFSFYLCVCVLGFPEVYRLSMCELVGKLLTQLQGSCTPFKRWYPLCDVTLQDHRGSLQRDQLLASGWCVPAIARGTEMCAWYVWSLCVKCVFIRACPRGAS